MVTARYNLLFSYLGHTDHYSLLHHLKLTLEFNIDCDKASHVLELQFAPITFR